MTIAIYTIADKTNGFGHIMRELTLAQELQTRGVEVVFVTPANTPGLDRLRKSAFEVVEDAGPGWSAEAETLIIDVEHGPRLSFLKTVRQNFKNIVTVCGSGYSVDDPAAVDELSDLVVEQNPFGNANARIADTLTGLAYILIDPRYAELTPDQAGPIVLSMGGADPYGLTQPVANALGAAGYPVTVIVGPAATAPDIKNGEPQIVSGPDSLLPHLDGAGLLIGALGMTAYEAAAAGVPALLVSWTSDHERTARLFGERGAAVNLGLAPKMNDAAITELIGDTATVRKYAPVWESMSRAGRQLCDGGGARRVADKLIELVGA